MSRTTGAGGNGPRPGGGRFRRDHNFELGVFAALDDHLDIEFGDHGATVAIRRRWSREARLFAADQIGQVTARPARGIPES